jgi:hypothetical protein
VDQHHTHHAGAEVGPQVKRSQRIVCFYHR